MADKTPERQRLEAAAEILDGDKEGGFVLIAREHRGEKSGVAIQIGLKHPADAIDMVAAHLTSLVTGTMNDGAKGAAIRAGLLRTITLLGTWLSADLHAPMVGDNYQNLIAAANAEESVENILAPLGVSIDNGARKAAELLEQAIVKEATRGQAKN